MRAIIPMNKKLLKRDLRWIKEFESATSFLTLYDQEFKEIDSSNASRITCREKFDGKRMVVYLREEPCWFSKDRYTFGAYAEGVCTIENCSCCERMRSIMFTHDMFNVMGELLSNQRWVAISGTVVGPEVNGNPYDLENCDFYADMLVYPGKVFPTTVSEVMLGATGLKFAPLIGVIETPLTFEQLKEYAKGPSAINPTVPRQGVILDATGVRSIISLKESK